MERRCETCGDVFDAAPAGRFCSDGCRPDGTRRAIEQRRRAGQHHEARVSPLDQLLADLGLARPGWQADAACRGLDPDLFFPGQGEATSEIKAVCASCPVQEECLLYALGLREQHGIWGGRSERERRKMRRRLHQAAKAAG